MDEVPYAKRYCWWRELIMWCGVCCLLIAGRLAGHAYANRIMHEIFDPEEAKRLNTS